MKYTLGTAAIATGKSKSTLSRDIKNGKISAIRGDNGSFEIDPAELHRVYSAVPRNSAIEQHETHETDAGTEGLKAQIELLKNERDDLRRRLDQEAEERRRLTMLLTHQIEIKPETEQKTASLLYKKLFGRK